MISRSYRFLQVLCLIPFFVTACQKKATAIEPDVLKAGTKIPAITMKPLESGVSREDEEVPLVVTEDVTGASGKVVVRKGAMVKARVAWSRREGTLDGVMGRPARLHIQFDQTAAVDGTTVPLVADEKLDPESTFELNRDNTGARDPSPQLKAILDDPQNEEAVRTLAQLLGDGKVNQDANTPEGREKLAKLCEEAGMAKTAELVKQNQLTSIEDLIDKAGSGGTVLALATGQAPLALDAVIETARFASTIPDRLTRALRGRNIKAYIGTPVVAYVAKDVQIQTQGTR